MGADEAQSRIQQVCFAPNKLDRDAPYDSVSSLDLAFYNPSDESEMLTCDAIRAYNEHEEQQQAKAKNAPAKPRPLDSTNSSIIDLVNQAYDIESVLSNKGYKQVGKKYLSPMSCSGEAGVIIFGDNKRIYSHHGDTDPLSALNHDAHSLDVFDVLCTLEFNGNVSQAIAYYAQQLDPQGQKDRQREYMEKKNAITPEQFEEIARKPSKKESDSGLPDFPEELLQLDGYLGELQVFITAWLIHQELLQE